MVTFTQFGCCVCRDIFSFLDELEYVPVYSHNAINITNIINESRLNIFETDIVADDNFSRRMQKLAFNHPSFEMYMKDIHSDYLIFDLGDERLPIQDWIIGEEKSEIPVTWGTYRTYLKAKENHEYADGLKIANWHLADKNMQGYEEKIQEFCRVILNKFAPDHIIYVSVRQAKEFINKNEMTICNFNDYEGGAIYKAEIRNKQDIVIEKAEKILLNNIPNMWKIDIPENRLSDDRHQWGRHTLHFNYIVYDYLAECIKLIANKNMSEEQKIKIKRAIEIRKRYAEIKLEDIRYMYSKNKSV